MSEQNYTDHKIEQCKSDIATLQVQLEGLLQKKKEQEELHWIFAYSPGNTLQGDRFILNLSKLSNDAKTGLISSIVEKHIWVSFDSNGNYATDSSGRDIDGLSFYTPTKIVKE